MFARSMSHLWPCHRLDTDCYYYYYYYNIIEHVCRFVSAECIENIFGMRKITRSTVFVDRNPYTYSINHKIIFLTSYRVLKQRYNKWYAACFVCIKMLHFMIFMKESIKLELLNYT